MGEDSQFDREPHLHSVYPHEHGRLPGCPGCDWHCHCGPGVAEGRETVCVWLGHEENEKSDG